MASQKNSNVLVEPFDRIGTCKYCEAKDQPLRESEELDGHICESCWIDQVTEDEPYIEVEKESKNMGMSTHVTAIKPPNEKWKKMKAVWDACKAAGLNPPQEVQEFFKGEPPDDAGVLIAMEKMPGYRHFSTDSADHYEIELDRLGPDVKFIRFTNSH